MSSNDEILSGRGMILAGEAARPHVPPPPLPHRFDRGAFLRPHSQQGGTGDRCPPEPLPGPIDGGVEVTETKVAEGSCDGLVPLPRAGQREAQLEVWSPFQ